MKINWRDIAVRAVKTFLQAFIATFTAGMMGVYTAEALYALLFSAFVAALAALLSFVQNLILQTK